MKKKKLFNSDLTYVEQKALYLNLLDRRKLGHIKNS